jgi:predicted house-cleaning noncanonical NTP pyrophosphatase (MazG superfamily)
MKEYNKLIRDKIPEIIAAKGEKAVIHMAGEEEFLEKAQEKLGEEVLEYRESTDPEELADLLEVVYAVAAAHGLSEEALNKIRQDKKEERGGFDKRIILERS